MSIPLLDNVKQLFLPPSEPQPETYESRTAKTLSMKAREAEVDFWTNLEDFLNVNLDMNVTCFSISQITCVIWNWLIANGEAPKVFPPSVVLNPLELPEKRGNALHAQNLVRWMGTSSPINDTKYTINPYMYQIIFYGRPMRKFFKNHFGTIKWLPQEIIWLCISHIAIHELGHYITAIHQWATMDPMALYNRLTSGGDTTEDERLNDWWALRMLIRMSYGTEILKTQNLAGRPVPMPGSPLSLKLAASNERWRIFDLGLQWLIQDHYFNFKCAQWNGDRYEWLASEIRNLTDTEFRWQLVL